MHDGTLVLANALLSGASRGAWSATMVAADYRCVIPGADAEKAECEQCQVYI